MEDTKSDAMLDQALGLPEQTPDYTAHNTRSTEDDGVNADIA